MSDSVRRSLCLVLAAITLPGVSACTPPVTNDAPGITGTVVDGTTGHPIKNAEVSMDCVGGYQEVGTDEKGYFYLPAMQTVNVPFVTPKNLGDGGTLKVESPGYRTYTESGLGARHTVPGAGRSTAGSMAAGRTGPDFDHARIALVPKA